MKNQLLITILSVTIGLSDVRLQASTEGLLSGIKTFLSEARYTAGHTVYPFLKTIGQELKAQDRRPKILSALSGISLYTGIRYTASGIAKTLLGSQNQPILSRIYAISITTPTAAALSIISLVGIFFSSEIISHIDRITKEQVQGK